jgi:hypothetical protein
MKDERIILTIYPKNMQYEGVEWIHLAEDNINKVS